MKKMIAVLLGLGLGLMSVESAVAQNLPNRYDANGIGTVNYSLNSGGSSYGQIFNSAASSLWSLGYGSSQGTSGTAVLSWNSSGQVGVGTTAPSAALEIGSGSNNAASAQAVRVKSNGILEFHGGAVPTLGSCGTNPSVVSGSDQAGDFTLGSAAVTTCTMTLAASGAYTNSPHCFVNNRTSKLVGLAQPSGTSSVVVVGTTASGPFGDKNDVIDYLCLGHN